jgi:molecular chaperone GrpE (heat shock protein)
MHETKLTSALRSATNGETEQFLTHRSALRRTMIRILADIDNSNWTMADDHALDLAEAWLKERLLRNGLPKVDNFREAFRAVEVHQDGSA